MNPFSKILQFFSLLIDGEINLESDLSDSNEMKKPRQTFQTDELTGTIYWVYLLITKKKKRMLLFDDVTQHSFPF